VVVPVFNQLRLTVRFLESFRQVAYPARQIIIVDDGSQDGTATHIRRDFPEVTVLEGDGNLWWAGAMNRGVRHALQQGYSYVLSLNNDTLVHPDFLDYLVETAEKHPGSIVGSRINFIHEPTRIWAVGSSMHWGKGKLFHLLHHGEDESRVLARQTNPYPVESLTGCGTLVPARSFEEVGLYDEQRYPQYHADSEFVLRAARRGYRALVDLRAVVWNDSHNTCAVSIRRFTDFFLSRRSAVYWRPILAIHRDYCPRHLMLTSLLQHYAWYLWFHDPRARRLKGFLKRFLPPRRRHGATRGPEGYR
jgi:GT2 family glycosyltransferase